MVARPGVGAVAICATLPTG
jgi:hypothetical protein